jgi:hypothetical protein
MCKTIQLTGISMFIIIIILEESSESIEYPYSIQLYGRLGSLFKIISLFKPAAASGSANRQVVQVKQKPFREARPT